MPHDSHGIQIAALWENTTKDGKTYYSGYLGDAKICGWLVTEKKSPKQPDMKLVLYKRAKPTTPKKHAHEEEAF